MGWKIGFRLIDWGGGIVREWEPVTPPNILSFFHVIWSPISDKFIVSGQNGSGGPTIYRSQQGTSWTTDGITVSCGTNNPIRFIESSVSGTLAGVLSSSTILANSINEGVNWTCRLTTGQLTAGSFAKNTTRNVYFGRGTTTGLSNIHYSDDTVTWTAVTVGSPSSARPQFFSANGTSPGIFNPQNGRFYGCGQRVTTSDPGNWMGYSTDAITWTVITSPLIGQGAAAIATAEMWYVNDTMFASTWNNTVGVVMYKSTDGGVSWTPVSVPTIPLPKFSRLNGFVWTGSHYIIAYSDNGLGSAPFGHIFRSSDLVNWTNMGWVNDPLTPTEMPRGLAYDNNGNLVLITTNNIWHYPI